MRLRIALAAGVLLVPAAANAAPSAWKTVKTTNLRGDERILELAAGSPNAAWALGSRGYNKLTWIGYHWNGKKWRSTPLPKGLDAPLDGPGGYTTLGGGTTLSASSARNAWALAGNPSDTRPIKILRWTGERWVIAKTVKNLALTTIAAVGSQQAMAFGTTRKGSPVVLKFDGRRWTTAKTPMSVSDTAVTRKHVWASGENARTGALEVRRYDGRRWTSSTIAGLLPKNVEPTQDRPGRIIGFSDISSSGPGQVTVSGRSMVTAPLSKDPEPSKDEPFLLSGDGQKWKADPLKGWDVRAHAADGRGGLYAIAMSPDLFTQTILHRSKQGNWTRDRLPKSELTADALARVPGTTTVWAAASGVLTWDTDGIIMSKAK